jgi:hypothetical protein
MICNQGVTSSNLVAGTMFFNDLAPISCGALSVVDTQWTQATDSTRDPSLNYDEPEFITDVRIGR